MNNGVDPQDLIEKYGADTARIYTMFTAPPEATLEWNDAAVEGSYRFLRRVWNFGVKLSNMQTQTAEQAPYSRAAADLRREIHSVFKQVDYDYQRMQYNTVVSGAMKMLNALEDNKPDGSAGDGAAQHACFGMLLRALYPVSPHIADALWNELGYVQAHGDLIDAAWPQVDPKALEQDEIDLVLQVNGKLRGAIRVPANADKKAIEHAAVTNEVFVKLAQGAPVRKVIIVPGRLVNLVI